MTAGHCPYCLAVADDATGLTGAATPKAGDYGVCFYCAGLIVFDGAGGLLEPDADQLGHMLGIPILMAAQRVIRNRLAGR